MSAAGFIEKGIEARTQREADTLALILHRGLTLRRTGKYRTILHLSGAGVDVRADSLRGFTSADLTPFVARGAA